MGEIKSFKELKIWREGVELVKKVYLVTKYFPKEEMFNLTSQMRRASISVPANISEGFRRRHSKEFRQFLNITLGSLSELETHLVIAKELAYISDQNFSELSGEIDLISRMTTSLYKKISI